MAFPLQAWHLLAVLVIGLWQRMQVFSVAVLSLWCKRGRSKGGPRMGRRTGP
jgi:hypothetical protein